MALATLIARSAAQPVNPVCLSWRRIDALIDLVAGISWGPIRAFQVMQFNAPTLTFGPVTGPVFRAPNCPVSEAETTPSKGQKALRPRPSPVAEWSFWNPFGMTGGDPKHTRAEQEES